MIWYLIGVYITNRTLHGRLEIPNFSSRVEKNISFIRCAHSWNIFQHSKRNFVSPRGHVISSIYVDDDIDIGIDQDDKKKDSYTLTKPHKPPAEKMSGKEQESSTTRLLQTACQPLASRKIHCKWNQNQIKNMIYVSKIHLGEQGWHTGESTSPGFKSRQQCHICGVGWLICCWFFSCWKRFFTGYSGFRLSSKSNILKSNKVTKVALNSWRHL